MLIWIGREVSDQVLTNLITAGAAILGAMVGSVVTLIATNRSLDYTRRKDNVQIRRDHLETSIRSLGELVQHSDFYMNESLNQKLDVDDLLSRIRERALAISNCISATPWVFPDQARELHAALKNAVLEVEYERNRQHVGCEPRSDSTSPEPDQLVMRRLDCVVERMYEVHNWASTRLNDLTADYTALVQGGIPR